VRRWLERAKEKLVEPTTGMLGSSFTWSGLPLDGPEGSTIWMSAHMLQIVDADFAEDQYRRARRELGRTILGFGVAREWPVSKRGDTDIDSGFVVPVVDASAGSSGLALLGAAAFRDGEWLRALLTSLEFAAFPSRRGGKLRYRASNQVGDAVLLYARIVGPLWAEVRRR
jgi:hypothetical protein